MPVKSSFNHAPAMTATSFLIREFGFTKSELNKLNKNKGGVHYLLPVLLERYLNHLNRIK